MDSQTPKLNFKSYKVDNITFEDKKVYTTAIYSLMFYWQLLKHIFQKFYHFYLPLYQYPCKNFLCISYLFPRITLRVIEVKLLEFWQKYFKITWKVMVLMFCSNNNMNKLFSNKNNNVYNFDDFRSNKNGFWYPFKHTLILKCGPKFP